MIFLFICFFHSTWQLIFLTSALYLGHKADPGGALLILWAETWEKWKCCAEIQHLLFSNTSTHLHICMSSCRSTCWRTSWVRRPRRGWRPRLASTSCCCRTKTCCSTSRCWLNRSRIWRPKWLDQTPVSRSIWSSCTYCLLELLLSFVTHIKLCLAPQQQQLVLTF